MSVTTITIRTLLEQLVHQIEIGGFTDELGHRATMLKPYHDAKAAIGAIEKGAPHGIDVDWTLAMAEALGFGSPFEVPVVPNAEAFRRLFMAVRERAHTGWVIENGKNEGDGLAYRFIDNDGGGVVGWTPDKNKALRFARREDAEAFAHHDEDAWRVTQHLWRPTTPPIADGLQALPCAVQRDPTHPQFGWLFIPHVDGQWVSAARLQPFSLSIIEHWQGARKS